MIIDGSGDSAGDYITYFRPYTNSCRSKSAAKPFGVPDRNATVLFEL
jgi:hypothetical protein